MKKKHRKILITLLFAFGVFVNIPSNIQDGVNNPSLPLSTSLYSDPIIGDH